MTIDEELEAWRAVGRQIGKLDPLYKGGRVDPSRASACVQGITDATATLREFRQQVASLAVNDASAPRPHVLAAVKSARGFAIVVAALLGEPCTIEIGALLDLVRKAIADRDKALADYRFMVERACDEKLDGYRELGARAAAAENKCDDLEGEALYLRGVLEGFEHEAQQAIDDRANRGGMKAGIARWAGVPPSVCADVARAAKHARDEANVRYCGGESRKAWLESMNEIARLQGEVARLQALVAKAAGCDGNGGRFKCPVLVVKARP